MSRIRIITREDNDVMNDMDVAVSDTATLEMTEAANELDAVQEAIDEGIDTMDTAETIVDNLDDVIEEGGLTEGAANVISTSIEHMRRRMGFSARKKLVPSMESFSTKSTRIQATRIVQEGLIDMVKKLWRGIKELFNKAVEWVKSFYFNWFTSIGRLNARANSMLGKLDGLVASEKPGNVDYEESAKILSDGKTVITNPSEIGKILVNSVLKTALDKIKTILKENEELCTLVETDVDSVNKYLDIEYIKSELVKEFSDSTTVTESYKSFSMESTDIVLYDPNHPNVKKSLENAVESAIMKFLKTRKSPFPNVKPPKGYDIPDGSQLTGFETGVGNMGIYVLLPRHSQTSLDYLLSIGKSKGFIDNIDGDDYEGPSKTDAPCWTKGTMEETCAIVIEAISIAKTVMESKDFSKGMEKMNKDMDKISKKAESEKNPYKAKEQKYFVWILKSAMQFASTFVIQFTSFITKVIHAMLDVMDKCIRIHQGKD